MCKRIESIDALSEAALKLEEACEIALHRPPPRMKNPFARVVHDAFRELPITPPDMAVQLSKIGRHP